MRGFITLAFGNRDYIEMAAALIASFRRFGSTTPFAVISDRPAHRLLRDFDITMPLDAELGAGVVQKLQLDRYSPFAETMFIDCDCLFYKEPDSLWHLYAPYDDFGVKGFQYFTPDRTVVWVDDLGSALASFGVTRFPHLNGGIYYFRDTMRARTVFDLAREVYRDRQRLGLRPFKGAPLNDEIAISLAIEKVGVELLPWCGRAMDMTFEMEDQHSIDIRVPCSRFSVHGRTVEPIVVHFNVGAQYSKLYALERSRILHLHSPVAARVAARTFHASKNARRLARRFAEELRGGRALQSISRRLGHGGISDPSGPPSRSDNRPSKPNS